MITNAILHIVFELIGWLLSFLPGGTMEMLATNTLNVFGFGVWLLGEGFFSLLVSVVFAELTGDISFNFVRFIINLVRGSGC